MAGMMGDENRHRNVRSIFIATFIGTTIEQYDFLLYGTMATLVFNRLFFPSLDPMVGMIAALGTYSVGFFARPIGAIICGHFADRFGRKPMLVASLLLMGGATVLIGCVPTYDKIGIVAPISITILRFVQGFANGADLATATLIAVENAPAKHRGFFGSWVMSGGYAGILLSSAAIAAVSRLPSAEFDKWGWRIPFLMSVVLVFVGLLARSRVPESTIFLTQSPRSHVATLPLMRLLKGSSREVLIALGVRVGESGWVFFLLTFVLSYASNQGVPTTIVVQAIGFAAATGLLAVPTFGALSDRLGRKPVVLCGAILAILFIYPLFMMLNTRDPFITGVALVIALGLIHPMMFGPEGAFFAELFRTSTRCSGVAFGQQIAGAVGGGLTPVITTALLVANRGDKTFVALYIAGLLAITIVATICARETLRLSLDRPTGNSVQPTDI